MLRKVRRITPLVRALLFGTLVGCGGVVATTTLVGCADENDPATHVDRLNDPMKRAAAVKRLLQFYEDAMTNDKKNREGENVKPLLETIVPPLTELSQKGELDSRAQGDVLAFLADSRHESALPALLKALDDYKPDDKRADEYDNKMGDVVRNIGEMVRSGKIKDNKDVNGALFKIFRNLRASTPKAQNRAFFRILNNVLVQISDPSWEAELITMLGKPIKSAKQKHLKALTNEVYWQVTAAEILGGLKSKKAVKALIKVVLSPFKANVGTTAINALIKVGQPAIDAGVALMNGSDTELKDYAASEFERAAEDREEKLDKKGKKSRDTAYLNNGVVIVGNIGTEACLAPMLATIDKGDKVTKSLVASELQKLPTSDQAKEKFKEVYATVGVNDKIRRTTTQGGADRGRRAVLRQGAQRLHVRRLPRAQRRQGRRSRRPGHHARRRHQGRQQGAVAVRRCAEVQGAAQDQGQSRQVLFQGRQKAEGRRSLHRGRDHRQVAQARDQTGHHPQGQRGIEPRRDAGQPESRHGDAPGAVPARRRERQKVSTSAAKTSAAT